MKKKVLFITGSRADYFIQKPLMNEIKKQAKEMQSSRNPGGPMFGKEMKAELNKFAIKWADKELAGGSDAVRGMLENKSDINSHSWESILW